MLCVLFWLEDWSCCVSIVLSIISSKGKAQNIMDVMHYELWWHKQHHSICMKMHRWQHCCSVNHDWRKGIFRLSLSLFSFSFWQLSTFSSPISYEYNKGRHSLERLKLMAEYLCLPSYFPKKGINGRAAPSNQDASPLNFWNACSL